MLDRRTIVERPQCGKITSKGFHIDTSDDLFRLEYELANKPKERCLTNKHNHRNDAGCVWPHTETEVALCPFERIVTR